MGPDKAVDSADFVIGQTRIRFGKRYQLVRIPDGKGIVGIEPGPSPMAALGVQQDGIDHQRVDLPFPPVTPPAAHPVRGGQSL